MCVSILGVYLMALSQERIAHATRELRSELLPAGRLFEQARTELDVQIQELTVLTSTSPDLAASPDNRVLLRLGPAARSILALHSSPLGLPRIQKMVEPWMAATSGYQKNLSLFLKVSEAIAPLKELRQNTDLVGRAIDREVSVQLLGLGEKASDHLVTWISAIALSVALMMGFIFLQWRWMRPLDKMREWLSLSGHDSDAVLPTIPPPSVRGSGMMSPPQEVQALVQALRFHVERFRLLARELEFRSNKNLETEKSMGTLFAALQYLVRHNDQLLDELIKKERLASMGEMAAQLAHEIRNPLNSLNLKLELLREDLNPSQQQTLDKVLGEIDRLDALTESHLRTAKGSIHQSDTRLELGPQTSQPKKVIEEALEFLQAEFERSNIQAFAAVEAELDSVPVPENILKATLLNVLKNAREAIDSNDSSGLRMIRVEAKKVGANRFSIRVLDSGCGFENPPTDGKFASFNTTKTHGSGLGLATAQKMLEAYQVTLKIDTAQPPYKTCLELAGDLYEVSEFETLHTGGVLA
jgi:C4-dicarboxylate-specific signal transduction histidine kinase